MVDIVREGNLEIVMDELSIEVAELEVLPVRERRDQVKMRMRN